MTAVRRLVLTLHGAGGNAGGGLQPLLPLADPHRLLLCPQLARRHVGRDPSARLGERRPADRPGAHAGSRHLPGGRRTLAISGFSDGASYALSLGLANADLFTHVVAFSPGFVASGPRVGTPRVYISHGRSDPVLPIDRTTRRIVPRLEAAGIPTTVHEFDGPHLVPPHVAEMPSGG